jgi:hypothetical protein
MFELFGFDFQALLVRKSGKVLVRKKVVKFWLEKSGKVLVRKKW